MHTQQKQEHPSPLSNLWMLQTCQNLCIEERKIKIKMHQALNMNRSCSVRGSGDSSLILAGGSAISLSFLPSCNSQQHYCAYIQTSCHWPPICCGCVQEGPRVDPGLRLALSHPQHPHPNKLKRFACVCLQIEFETALVCLCELLQRFNPKITQGRTPGSPQENRHHERCA